MSQSDLRFLKFVWTWPLQDVNRSLSLHMGTLSASYVSGTFVCNMAAPLLLDTRGV